MTTGFDLDQFLSEVGLPDNLENTLAVQARLQTDEAIASWLESLQHGRTTGSRYWDLCCSLNLISRRLRPLRYLEIGVRRGKSMAQIAAHNPDCEIFGFDLWITPYAGVENPGPEFVRQEMRAVGYAGPLQMISGPSQQTVPKFLDEDRSMAFDVITVDGDHSDQGGWADLQAVAPHVRPGGFLLFDDLVNPHHNLHPIWMRFRASYRRLFQFAENLQDHWGTGIAYLPTMVAAAGTGGVTQRTGSAGGGGRTLMPRRARDFESSLKHCGQSQGVAIHSAQQATTTAETHTAAPSQLRFRLQRTGLPNLRPRARNSLR